MLDSQYVITKKCTMTRHYRDSLRERNRVMARHYG